MDQDLWNAIRKIFYKMYTGLSEGIFKVLSDCEVNEVRHRSDGCVGDAVEAVVAEVW